MKTDRVRDFSKKVIEEDCSELTGDQDNALFYGCTFRKLNGLSLKNCDLAKSQFVTKRIRDALGFTLTLNCHSFNDVEFSEELFDMMLALLTLSKGNDEKRKQLIEVIGTNKYNRLKRLLGVIE